jgi:hypothetical protein
VFQTVSRPENPHSLLLVADHRTTTVVSDGTAATLVVQKDAVSRVQSCPRADSQSS